MTFAVGQGDMGTAYATDAEAKVPHATCDAICPDSHPWLILLSPCNTIISPRVKRKPGANLQEGNYCLIILKVFHELSPVCQSLLVTQRIQFAFTLAWCNFSGKEIKTKQSQSTKSSPACFSPAQNTYAGFTSQPASVDSVVCKSEDGCFRARWKWSLFGTLEAHAQVKRMKCLGKKILSAL